MNEMVTITRDEYDRLREAAEDLADLQAFDRAKMADEETFPVEVVDRLLADESPVRVFREHRGMTQVQLALAANIGRGMIAGIETGRKAGSIETLKAIAAALNVDLDDIA